MDINRILHEKCIDVSSRYGLLYQTLYDALHGALKHRDKSEETFEEAIGGLLVLIESRHISGEYKSHHSMLKFLKEMTREFDDK